MIQANLDYRLLPTQIGITLTFFLVPYWYRFEASPPPFTANYVIGSLTGTVLMLTVFIWLVSGVPGFATLRRDPLRRGWALALLLLALWALISWNWAYERFDHPMVATGASLQLSLVALFAVAVACAAPPPRVIIFALLVSLLISGVVAVLQVDYQRSIGLEFAKELPLDPQKRGISVVQSGETRWLRPYGLTVHPNILAGFVVAALLTSGAWIVARRWWVRVLGVLAFWFGLGVLLLTFSRGAWIGFAAGAFALLPLYARQHLKQRDARRFAVVALVGAVILTGIFGWRYQDLLLARAGAGPQLESTEARSVSERLIYSSIAYEAIQRYPVLGVGSGNFPWFASDYLFYETDFRMRGDNVHQIYLYAQADLGIPGYGLFLLALILGVEAALRQRADQPGAAGRYALLAAVIAMAVIGLFDHYFWTIVHFQALLWGALALAGKPICDLSHEQTIIPGKSIAEEIQR